jgi:glycosyltransferase involved in cell wall biosynthesis
MRIFYVLNNRWPTIKAHGFQVAKTCEALQQAGANVHLVIPRRKLQVEITDTDPFELYGVRNRFAVTSLPSLDTTKGTFLFFVQQTLFALEVALYLMFKRGVVYTRDPFSAYVLSLVRRNVFWEAHRFPARPDSIFYKRLFNSISGIAVITHGLKKLFVEHGVPTERIVVIPDSVDPDEFNIREDALQARKLLGLPDMAHIIGYIGQLSTFGEEKGVSDLLRAYQIIRQQESRAILLIVGGNNTDIAKYKGKALSMGFKSTDVIFAGQQSHSSVPMHLRACDILAMPYPNTEHYAHYMSPLKLFEYMASGKSIVATDLPSIREVVSEREVFFCPPNEPETLAETINYALAHQEEGGEKAKLAFELVQQYRWSERGRRILEIL